MNTQRMLEIAKSLGEQFQTKAKTELIGWQAGKDLAAAELALIPPEGWPGKNQEQRDAAKKAALAADPATQDAQKRADMAHQALEEIHAQIGSLEAERRALEWEVRARLVEALDHNHVQQNGQGDQAEAAFDDAADNAVDYAEFSSPSAPATYEMFAPNDSDDLIPF